MRFAAVLVLAATLAGCISNPSKEEEEAAKNTIVCLVDNERLVIRFDSGMARILMPGGDSVWLYQLDAAYGTMRYSNGSLELRGKGLDLTLIDSPAATQRVLACTPYTVEKH